jgi:hypothetical protein
MALVEADCVHEPPPVLLFKTRNDVIDLVFPSLRHFKLHITKASVRALIDLFYVTSCNITSLESAENICQGGHM